MSAGFSVASKGFCPWGPFGRQNYFKNDSFGEIFIQLGNDQHCRNLNEGFISSHERDFQRNYKKEAQIGKSNSLLSIIHTILKLTFCFISISIKMYNTNTFSSFLSLCWLIDFNDRNSELTVTRISLKYAWCPTTMRMLWNVRFKTITQHFSVEISLKKKLI